MEQINARVTKTGFLFKLNEGQFARAKKWKKYYFHLRSNFLTWYKDRNSNEIIGMFDIENASINAVVRDKDKKLEGKEFELKNSSGTLNLHVDQAKERADWIEAIKMAKERHNAAATLSLDGGMRERIYSLNLTTI